MSHIIDNFILFYTVIIISAYMILAIISAFALINYFRRNRLTDYSAILSSPLTPGVSVIAPAYNAGKNIVNSVNALLLLHYPEHDVIVVNDGSTDDSLQKLIEIYELEKVNYFIDSRLETKTVKNVYKSHNISYKNLLVIDKEKGGKADALNTGINASSKPYIVSVDVDSIIEPDALLKLIKPFLEETDKKVIASGGVIRLANSCTIENGKVTNVNLPRRMLLRFQVLEYMRTFIMARMAWSKLNGMFILSGTLSMLDREIAIKCGGYYDQTVGEEMELIVRMRRYMSANGKRYKVQYIPETLCWTNCPDTYGTFESQRNRWTRGSIDTLLIHRKIFFNPKYGILGMLSYPFFLLFEWLLPIVETCGICYFLLLAIFGPVNWTFLILLFVFIYLYAVFMSASAIFIEQLAFHRYTKKSDVFRLILTALIEPFTYQLIITLIAISGNFMYFILGKKTWGVMKHRGFAKIRLDLL